jgi:hypothetical protein
MDIGLHGNLVVGAEIQLGNIADVQPKRQADNGFAV